MDGIANTKIGGTAAKIAGHGIVDIGVGGMRLLREQCSCRHNLSGLAIAALRHLFSDPGLLDRMETVCGKTFDGDDSLACRGCQGSLAGAGCGAVDVDGAGSAKSHAATVLCTGHIEQVAEHPEQGHLRIGLYGLLLIVDCEPKEHHCRLLVPRSER